MAIEVGKNRLEALGDVEETADLIRYYATRWRSNDGFVLPDGQPGSTRPSTHRSVMRPYGVWAVISPFNFPMALSGGPAGGALVAGNTVVFKPSHQGFFTRAEARTRSMRDAGVPAGVVQPGHGPGRDGRRRAAHEPGRRRHHVHRLVRGRACEIYRTSPRTTRSRRSARWAARTRRSCQPNADLDEAAEGVMRSAFGFSGQKCSANSRVYVERPVLDEFVRLLVEKTEADHGRRPARPRQLARPGHQREGRRRRYEQAVGRGAGATGRCCIGGERMTEGDLDARQLRRSRRSSRLPLDSPAVWRRAVRRRSWPWRRSTRSTRRSTLANDTEYGLTAGFYSRGPGRDRPVPRHGSRRASCTSTGAPARRPARGRACSRSAAGRAPARPARPAAAVLRPAVHARAEPDDRRLSGAAGAEPPSAVARRARPRSRPAAGGTIGGWPLEPQQVLGVPAVTSCLAGRPAVVASKVEDSPSRVARRRCRRGRAGAGRHLLADGRRASGRAAPPRDTSWRVSVVVRRTRHVLSGSPAGRCRRGQCGRGSSRHPHEIAVRGEGSAAFTPRPRVNVDPVAFSALGRRSSDSLQTEPIGRPRARDGPIPYASGQGRRPGDDPAALPRAGRRRAGTELPSRSHEPLC